MWERTADWDNCFENINILNERFDNCKPTIDKKKQVVEGFLYDLQWSYSSADSFFIRKSEFVGIGSSYENTAINWRTDFDIAMILPSPFSMEYFKCVQLEKPGLYKLQLIDNRNLNLQSVRNFSSFLNPTNHLLVGALRDRIFSELSLVLQNRKFDGYIVEFSRLASSFCVKLKKGRFFIKIDVVPQIKAKTRDIPGWKGENLPRAIDNFILKNDKHILCNLSSPPNFKNRNVKHLTVQPSLNLLEKEVMLDSATLRYSVCIAKSVYKHYKWASKGLRSFHIKRIALSLHSAIQMRESSWIGYLLIMKEIIRMLESGTIDGCFIEGQNLICIDKFRCQQLAMEVEEAYKTTYPDDVLQFLEPPGKISRASLEPKQYLNITSFEQNNATSWFKRLENEFSVHNIFSNEARFYFAFHFLSQEIRMRIPASVITQHSYSYLMCNVLSLCRTSDSINFNQRFIDAATILPPYIRTSQRSNTDVVVESRVKRDLPAPTNSGLLIPNQNLNINAATVTTSGLLANQNFDNAAANTSSRSIQYRDQNYEYYADASSRSVPRPNQYQINNASTPHISVGSSTNRHQYQPVNVDIAVTRPQYPPHVVNICTDHIRPTSPQSTNIRPTSPQSTNIRPTSPQSPNIRPTSPQSTNIISVFSEALSAMTTRCRKFFRNFGKCITCYRENNVN